MNEPKNLNLNHFFCYNKKEIEVIHVKFHDSGQPSPCFVAHRYEKEYLVIYLDAFDSDPYCCYMTPIEDLVNMSQEENDYMLQSLNPKVIKLNKLKVTFTLWENTYTLKIDYNYKASPSFNLDL